MSYPGHASAAEHTGPGRGRQRITKRGLFTKDLPSMMFGFGDTDPQKEAVALMEEMVVEHVTDVLSAAHKVSTNRGKLKVDDIVYALRSSASKTHPSALASPSNVAADSSTAGPSRSLKQGDLAPRYVPYRLARRKATLEEKQLARIEELLFMQEDLARARGRADDLAAYGEDAAEAPSAVGGGAAVGGQQAGAIGRSKKGA